MSLSSTELMFARDGYLLVKFHRIAAAAGPYLNQAPDAIESFLVVGPDVQLGVRDRYVGGVRTPRKDLFAARVLGDSMIDHAIRNGDTCIFESVEQVRTGQITLVEKTGIEEGEGAWAIKKIIIKQPPGPKCPGGCRSLPYEGGAEAGSGDSVRSSSESAWSLRCFASSSESNHTHGPSTLSWTP